MRVRRALPRRRSPTDLPGGQADPWIAHVVSCGTTLAATAAQHAWDRTERSPADDVAWEAQTVRGRVEQLEHLARRGVPVDVAVIDALTADVRRVSRRLQSALATGRCTGDLQDLRATKRSIYASVEAIAGLLTATVPAGHAPRSGAAQRVGPT